VRSSARGDPPGNDGALIEASGTASTRAATETDNVRAQDSAPGWFEQATPINVDEELCRIRREAEQCVLGACLVWPETVLPTIVDVLPTDFYERRHQVALSAIRATKESGRLVDAMSVGQHMHADDLRAVGGFDYLLELQEAAPFADSEVETSIEAVREDSRQRRITEEVLALAELAARRVPAAELLARVEKIAGLGALGRQVTDPSVASVLDGMRKRGPVTHEPTGVEAFDELTGGGLPIPSRIYLNGAPDSGKTLLIAQWTDRLLDAGLVVGMLCVDEDPSDVLQRFMQRRGASRQECERLGDDLLAATDDAFSDVPLRLYDGDWTIEAAAADAAKIAQQRGTQAALFIDSVQSVKSNADVEDDTLNVRVAKNVRAIRSESTRHRMLIVSTSEMNRGAYRGGDKGEQPNDMAAGKHSGDIEYSARIMVSLRSVPGESDLVALKIVKNKHGRSHRENEAIHLRVNREGQRLIEDDGYEPADDDEVRASRAREREVSDAALLAVILAEDNGTVGVNGAYRQMRDRHNLTSKGRIDGARTLLQDCGAIEEGKAPNNKKPLWLIGSKVPTEVLNAVPIELRPGVAAATRRPE